MISNFRSHDPVKRSDIGFADTDGTGVHYQVEFRLGSHVLSRSTHPNRVDATDAGERIASDNAIEALVSAIQQVYELSRDVSITREQVARRILGGKSLKGIVE